MLALFSGDDDLWPGKQTDTRLKISVISSHFLRGLGANHFQGDVDGGHVSVADVS